MKWATCNVGASSPEDYGDYFAWGETQPKSSYNVGSSKTYGKKMRDISGDSRYDAARYNWGGTWRMPTKEEIKELKDKCTWQRTKNNGVNGMLVTCPNGNSIFFPAAGGRYGTSLDYAGEDGSYWSFTPHEDYNIGAYGLGFDANGDYGYNWADRCYGYSVRPVQD